MGRRLTPPPVAFGEAECGAPRKCAGCAVCGKGGVCRGAKGIGEIESRRVWGKHHKPKAVVSRGNSPQLCSAKPLGSPLIADRRGFLNAGNIPHCAKLRFPHTSSHSRHYAPQLTLLRAHTLAAPLILSRAASPHKRPYSNFPKKFCDIFRRISTFFDVEFCRMATKNVLSRRITTKSDELPRFNGLEIALNSCYYDYGRKSVIPAFIQRELETS